MIPAQRGRHAWHIHEVRIHKRSDEREAVAARRWFFGEPCPMERRIRWQR